VKTATKLNTVVTAGYSNAYAHCSGILSLVNENCLRDWSKFVSYCAHLIQFIFGRAR